MCFVRIFFDEMKFLLATLTEKVFNFKFHIKKFTFESSTSLIDHKLREQNPMKNAFRHFQFRSHPLQRREEVRARGKKGSLISLGRL